MKQYNINFSVRNTQVPDQTQFLFIVPNKLLIIFDIMQIQSLKMWPTQSLFFSVLQLKDSCHLQNHHKFNNTVNEEPHFFFQPIS